MSLKEMTTDGQTDADGQGVGSITTRRDLVAQTMIIKEERERREEGGSWNRE